MRIYNMTDVATPKLKQHKLVNQTLSISGLLIAPGESAELRGSVEDHAHVRHVVAVGAAAVDDLPKEYAKAKVRKAPATVIVADVVPVTDTPPISKRKSF